MTSRGGDGTAFAIDLAGVGKAFGGLTALAGVDLSLPQRSRTAIVGPSGGGKTTLLQVIAGLLEPDTGLVRVEGATAAAQRLAHCALMPQRDLLLPWRTALDSITRAQLQEWLRQAMDAVPRTILLVTHDVEEALLLCQRVVVLSQRPGRVVTVLEGGDGFQGSRREIVTSPEFASLKERALAVLGP